MVRAVATVSFVAIRFARLRVVAKFTVHRRFKGGMVARNVGDTALLQGATVFDRHGERIGIAADPGGAVFVVEEGIWFVKDRYLPKDVIARMDETGAYLRISMGEAHRIGHQEPPGADDPWATHESSAPDATVR